MNYPTRNFPKPQEHLHILGKKQQNSISMDIVHTYCHDTLRMNECNLIHENHLGIFTYAIKENKKIAQSKTEKKNKRNP